MKYFLFGLLMMGNMMCYASEDVQTQTQTVTYTSAGHSLVAEGNRFSSSQNTDVSSRSYYTSSAYGVVSLSCPTAFTSTLLGSATVNVTIRYQVEANGTFTEVVQNEALKIEFSNGYAADIAYVKLDGAQKITVEVVPSGVTKPAGWPELELKAEVHTNSFEKMLRNFVPSGLAHDAALTSDGNLSVHWSAASAAEYYELEWTYVSDQGESPSVRLTAAQVEVDPFLFRNNSSRIESKDLSYQIPLVYEKGFIIYRLRAVGKNLSNGVEVLAKSQWTIREEDNYTYVGSFPPANVYTYDGLEQNMNWQSSLSFAEEGKHKVVLSYHDGSSRSRQAVTRINSDKRAVVGETLYDYNGRPLIQVLPVPVTENTLTYFPTFNLIEGSSQLNKADFDNAVEGKTCDPVAPPLDDDQGASRYYSPKNNFTTGGDNTGSDLLNRNLIPDAQDYPYTQTNYTADNTGRINSQSGVGYQYRIGSGRETSYKYGSPQQPELTRLFGPQVGYAGHYKKNAVMDPNRQTSVSYIDLDGKVVATALSGTGATQLEALNTNKLRTIKTDLLQENSFSNALSVDKLSKTYSSKFSVTDDTPYKFSYTGIIGHYDLTCSQVNAQVPFIYKMNGVVSVQWKLTNGCGETVFSGSGETLKGNSGTAQTMSLTPQDLTLPSGEYQLTKELKINNDKLEEYWQDYLAINGTCLLSLVDFETEETNKMNLLGCGLTCEQCITERDRLLAVPGISAEDVAALTTACDELCDPSIGCRSSLEAMRGDMSMGGQYGKIRKSKTNESNGMTQPQFDENNQPITPAIDIQLNNSSDGNIFDGDNPDDQVIVVEQFPMSIYNPGNGLRLHPMLKSAIQDYNDHNPNLSPAHIPSWRNPILVTKTGYTKQNQANQILFDNVDLSGQDVSYQVVDYTDETGAVYMVDVRKVIVDEELGTYVFSPEIWNDDESKLQVVDAELGFYQIKVKYLKNIKDFETLWKEHWSNYLVPYHPEFSYLLDCTADQAIMEFEYNLLNTQTIDQALTKNYLDAGWHPQIVGTNTGNTKDPFLFKESNHEYIKNLTEHYITKTVNNEPVYYNLAQAATMAVGCPKGTENCAVPGCMDGVLNTDDEWNTYKTLYISEKQKLNRQLKLRKAVDGAFYNGCIGHPDIASIPDAEYFRRPTVFLNPIEYYRRCGNYWLNGYEYVPQCQDIQVTYGANYVTYPYLHPSQICFIGEVNKYKDMQQRFYPNLPLSPGGGEMAYECSTYVDSDVEGQPPIMVPIPCGDDIDAANISYSTEAQRIKYEQCGQCPMALDLEHLLSDLNKENILISATPVLLTCPSDNVKLVIGPAVESALLALSGNLSDVFWQSSLSSDMKTLTGYLKTSGSQVLATITLTIPADLPITFATLKYPCCLNADPNNGTTFTMQSSYISSTTGQEVNFNLNGTSTIPLAPCYIAPRCLVTSDARRIIYFLNTLSTSAPNLTYKTHNLNTNGAALNLLDAGVTDEPSKLHVDEYYFASLRGMLKKDNQDVSGGYVEDVSIYTPIWTSTLAMGTIVGTLSYTENSTVHNIHVEVSDIPATINTVPVAVTDIKEFVNVHPEPLTQDANDLCNGSCQKQSFLADVLMQNNSVRGYATVRIYVPLMTPVICQPAVPAAH